MTLEPSSGALARELAKKYQLEIIDLGAGGRQDSDAPPTCLSSISHVDWPLKTAGI